MPDLSHLIIISILAALSGALLYICSYKMLQIYQMSSYRTKEVFTWLKGSKFDYLFRYFSLAFFIFVPTSIFVAAFGRYQYIQYIGFIFFIGLCVLFNAIVRKQIKVPLKFTPRVIRLSILLIVIYVLCSFLLIFLTPYIYLQYTFVGILPLLIPLFVMLANTIMLPVEKGINAVYKRLATKKLESMPSLIKIGITGSYGKTTTKNILSACLSKKFKVCASPQSFNTPMGLTRVINDNLREDDEIFIAEMGARYQGDIKELCQLVKPRIGILTAIGEMHLETFGSIENIRDTKYELIKSLSSDGLAIFCGDNDILCGLYEQCGNNKLISASRKSQIMSQYSNVIMNENGTTFDLLLGEETVKIQTKLLGMHIPSLIALCALTAYELGVSHQQIAEAAAELQPVPHRLELIKNGDTLIIDDAYNSNPSGAKNALELLSGFEGTKIIVTPGMIELGEKSNELHIEFGQEIAKQSDYAILIGRNAAKIKEGILLANSMPENKIFTVKTLEEATARLASIEGKRVVLFENDLPDNY